MADQDFPYYIVLLALGVCTGLFYEISIVTYRLFFHPLRSFPGPKLAAATFLYETFFDVVRKPGGQFIYELDRLHAKYGRVVRCNPDEIHVRDSEWYDVLYAGPGKVRNKWERSNRANGSPGSVASTTQHELHRQRRGALNSYFSKKAVVSLEKDTRSKVDRACELLKANAEEGKVVNLGAVFTAITLDVITTYCYDACLNCIEEPDFAPRWQKLMNGLFEGVPIAKHFPQIMNAMQSLPPSILARLKPEFLPFLETKDAIGKQAREIWNAENDSTNSEKSAGDEKAKTIFHGIMHSRLPPEERAVERLVDEAFILIVAGGETTARVLTVILTHLLQNEDLFARVRQELDQVVDRDGSPDLPESRVLEDLPLVKAVVQEGVRMAAPVTNRQTLIAPNEDLKCNGFVIPRGVSNHSNTVLRRWQR